MARARRELISLTDTPYYHCIARCVRRAFLCGVDRLTGTDFSHRREWVLDRLQTLSTMFAIDICSYSIMSNHYHLVLKADFKRAQLWSNEEVIDRWNVMFAGHDLVKRFRAGQLDDPAAIRKAIEIVNELRERLSDISWYMRTLNEHIARRANAEDGCTGRFWEGRFKSQALLDEQAVLTCMAYVDLNPIRAGMAPTPEASDFTSIQQRIAAITAPSGNDNAKSTTQPETPPRYPLRASGDANGTYESALPRRCCPLLDFIGWVDSSAGIPFRLEDYLELVDWSGRIIRADKSGRIAAGTPSILGRLGIDDGEFLQHVSPKSPTGLTSAQARPFPSALGTSVSLKRVAVLWCRKFFKGLSKAQRLYPVAQAN
jgi:putative transposase